VHPFNHLGKAFLVPNAIQTSFSGQLSPSLGHDRHLVRPDLFCDFNDRFSHAHFEIQLARNRFFQQTNVPVADVPSVLAQVNGNSVCTGQLALGSGPDGVRLIGQPGLPDCSDVVYIYIQHSHFLALDLFAGLYHCAVSTQANQTKMMKLFQKFCHGLYNQVSIFVFFTYLGLAESNEINLQSLIHGKNL